MEGTRSGQHGLDGLAAGFAEERSELSREAAAHGLGPEEEAAHAGDDQQQRTESENTE